MAQFMVRTRKLRAVNAIRSADQEHREILKPTLKGPRRKHLSGVLARMPEVGEDADSARDQSNSRARGINRSSKR